MRSRAKKLTKKLQKRQRQALPSQMTLGSTYCVQTTWEQTITYIGQVEGDSTMRQEISSGWERVREALHAEHLNRLEA